jgi:hypothetical protein
MTIAPLLVTPDDYSLLTDLYQLTMTACYAGEGLDQRRASFELFARRLPENFGYLIAMGLTQALEFLQNFHFSDRHLDDLKGTGIFDQAPSSVLGAARRVAVYRRRLGGPRRHRRICQRAVAADRSPLVASPNCRNLSTEYP